MTQKKAWRGMVLELVSEQSGDGGLNDIGPTVKAQPFYGPEGITYHFRKEHWDSLKNVEKANY